ncbi:MAG: transporter substrate-binding protein [Firmicutes bacterium]|nr:transporter substrate-binding protein [Bacillota bacterium]
MRRRIVGSLLTAAVALSVTACGGGNSTGDSAQGASGAPQQGGKLIVGMQYEPVTLDPHVTGQANGIRIILNMCDSLVYADDKGQVQPWLAESWEANPEGTAYTFHLKKDVKFSDGTPFNAQAVKFSWDRIMDPKTASQSAISALRPYKESQVVDDSTLKVTLSEPSAIWLKNLGAATTAPVSPAAVQKLGDQFGRSPVCVGPFKLKEWKEKESVTLVRNPDYNSPSPAFGQKGAPVLDEVTWKFIPENQVRFSTLETGETNAIEDVPAPFVANVKADPQKYTLLNVPYPGSPRQYMINTKQFPTDDIAVRQAILYGVNTKAIIKTLYADAFPDGNGPMGAATWGASKGIFRELYPQGADKANAVLDQAGWKPGPGGIRVKDGKRLEIVVNVMSDVPEYGELGQLLQAQLRDVGMDLKLKSLSRSPWYASNAKGDYNITGMGLWSTDPDMLKSLYRTDGSVFTWSHFTNPDYDKLVDEGARTSDPTKRLEIYKQAQEIVMKEALVLPIYDQVNLLATQSNIKGIFFDANAYPHFYATYYVKK